MLRLETSSLKGGQHGVDSQDAMWARTSSLRLGGLGEAGGAGVTPPPRIPHLIHHVVISNMVATPGATRPSDLKSMGSEVVRVMETWLDFNPGWQWRFWDQVTVEALIKKHYPHLWTAWITLELDVERSDFSRYIILHRYGGMYADCDAAAFRPLSDLILPQDSMVVAWENILPASLVVDYNYGRQAQILLWWFASAPAHPALTCAMDMVRRQAGHRMYEHKERNVIELTGPSVLTDCALTAARDHPPAKRDGWNVRVMPRLVAGFWPGDLEVTVSPLTAVLHLFFGGWKTQLETAEAQSSNTKEMPWYAANFTRPSVMPLVPTTVPLIPRFEVLHHPKGEGEFIQGVDVGMAIAQFGTVMPGGAVGWPPVTLLRWLDMLEEGRTRAVASGVGGSGTVVDIGAGYGMFALAAGSREFPVLAFEASDRVASALEASAEYNGHSVSVSRDLLGWENARTCLDVEGQDGAEAAAALPGYGSIRGEKRRAARQDCAHAAKRLHALEAIEGRLGKGAPIAGLRISAGPWMPRLLRTLGPLLRSQARPPPLLLELELGDRSDVGILMSILAELRPAGYLQWQHVGPLCTAQWDWARTALLQDRRDVSLVSSAADSMGPCSMPEGVMSRVLHMGPEQGVEVFFASTVQA